MFENLVSQDAVKYIASDIKNNTFPRAVLFSGNNASGKLTAALEVSRVLSCLQNGDWNCTCSSCLRHKALTCTNMLLMGTRDCALEIEAAKDTFINAYKENAKYLAAARYLYLRSIRKLTLRFNSILNYGENNLNKIGNIIEEINEKLELLDFPKEIPPFDDVTKLCDELNLLALDLESNFLYNSIPINQIRNMESWAYVKSESGKKTIIIENAEKMQTGVRNALLKILEEPPEDCVFILLTSNRNAVMPTILSRVRTYNFKDRNPEKQKEVITRVFHNDSFNGSISDYLLTYLSVPAQKLQEYANDFFKEIVTGKIPDISELVKQCGKFEPKLELKLFLGYIGSCKRKLLFSQVGCEASSELLKVLQKCWENIYSYNQTVQAALEILTRDISKINVTYEKIFAKVIK